MAPSVIRNTAVSIDLIPPSYSLKLKACSKAVDQLSLLDDRWPLYRDSPLAWKGSQFVNEALYTHTLSESEIIEVDRALYHFKGIAP